MKQVGHAAVGGEGATAAFAAVVADLRSGREQVQAVRPELSFEDVPAPRTLAPFATAVGAAVRSGTDEIASGRFVVLYDPAGQSGWAGPLRVIVYVRADLEPEITADPLVGQVAWSWLTEALDTRAARYAAESGTVTRVVTEGFGAKDGEQPVSGVELRASWSPVTGQPPARAVGPGAAEPAGPEPAAALDGAALGDHLAAWCAVLCAASGLPPLTAGVSALRPPSRRRGP